MLCSLTLFLWIWVYSGMFYCVEFLQIIVKYVYKKISRAVSCFYQKVLILVNTWSNVCSSTNCFKLVQTCSNLEFVIQRNASTSFCLYLVLWKAINRCLTIQYSISKQCLVAQIIQNFCYTWYIQLYNEEQCLQTQASSIFTTSLYPEMLHKERTFFTVFCSSLKPTELIWEENY